MATLGGRPDNSEPEAADARGRSTDDVPREGVQVATSGAAREEKVRALNRRVMSDHANLLKRLGEA